MPSIRRRSEVGREWIRDAALPTFECTTLVLPAEEDGVLVATVLRKRSAPGTRRALLYVHGFIDYFFHEHVADAVRDAGWDFYALELRRYGRSLRTGNRPNYCRNLAEYDAELTAAIDIVMDEDGHDTLVLYGHSTGALIASLYADGGERRARIAGVVLNSPFFAFNVRGWQRMKLPIGIAVGALLPTLSDPHAVSRHYGESLHRSERGEWDYDLRWKPIEGFPAYFGWVRAIERGHRRVARGLAIACPVLVLHSDASDGGARWKETFRVRDIVLDVAHMRALSQRLGPRVVRAEIPGALHDVTLSEVSVRRQAVGTMTAWLDTSPFDSAA